MDDNSGNIDNLVLGELDNTIDGDAVLNQYKTDINTTLLQLLNEKDPIKRYSIQKTLNSFRRKEMFYVIGVYIKKFIFYIFLVLLFSFNLIAVAISLSINRGSALPKKILSSVYAFFFSIIYILINYRHYRLDIKKEVNTICPNNPFKFI
tara:strand:+ start:33 stop:482 length:450 start_codon:yes stop_codon:yes gene_type:complete